MVDLDTFDLMQPLEAIKTRGTIDVVLRVQNYIHSIMREAKRLRLITVNPAYDLEEFISARHWLIEKYIELTKGMV